MVSPGAGLPLRLERSTLLSRLRLAARQVTHYTITEADAMVIMASDGVWEFLSSQARSAWRVGECVARRAWGGRVRSSAE